MGILEDVMAHRRCVMENIEKSFGTGFNMNDELEKAKWNIGDTKVYQGVTYEVGGFNSKGSPLWRKKKESGSNNVKPVAGSTAKKDDSSIQSKNQQTVSANNSSTAQKNSNDVKKLNVDIDSDRIGSLLAVFHQYGTKEEYATKLQALQVLIDPSSNKEFWDHAFKVAQEKINKKDDGQSINNNVVKQPTPAVNNSSSKQAQDSSAKTSNVSQTAPQTPPESKNLSKISQVEEYAKSLKGVKFADAKTGWGEKNSKAFELTYPNGGKLFVDFYSNGEYVYKLTDSNGNKVIETSSTDMTRDTDWERKLNPNELILDRLKSMEKRLIKLKSERTKLKNKYFSRTYSFTDKFYYEQAQKEVDEMNSKIQKFRNLIGTF